MNVVLVDSILRPRNTSRARSFTLTRQGELQFETVHDRTTGALLATDLVPDTRASTIIAIALGSEPNFTKFSVATKSSSRITQQRCDEYCSGK